MESQALLITGIGKQELYLKSINVHSSYLYWVNTYKAWIIHTSLDGAEAAVYQRQDVECPNLVDGWNVYESSGWKKRDDVQIECKTLEDEFSVSDNQKNESPTQDVEWTEWTECSATCDGTQTRYKGEYLIGNQEQRDCGGLCPYWEVWSSWSLCSKTCNRGESIRQRTCYRYSL